MNGIYKEYASKDSKFFGNWQEFTNKEGNKTTYFEWTDVEWGEVYWLKNIDFNVAKAIIRYTKMMEVK